MTRRIRLRPPTPIERFDAKYVVNPYTGCWEWTANKVANGYGRFALSRRNMLAHRFAYETFVGPIPEGLQIDHLCRNRACVNPAHLEPVTHRENVLRGQAPSAVAYRRWASNGTCVRGHPAVEIYRNPRTGKPDCRACARMLRPAARRAAKALR